MASESIERMSMYYKGRIDARIANAGLAEKAKGQKTWIKAEKYNKNKKQDDPSCFFMRKNETLFGL